MENNKQNATLFIYQWVDENVVPDDTGKLSDMLIAYGNKLNIPDVSGALGFDKGYEQGYNDATREACQEIAKNYQPNDR